MIMTPTSVRLVSLEIPCNKIASNVKIEGREKEEDFNQKMSVWHKTESISIRGLSEPRKTGATTYIIRELKRENVAQSKNLPFSQRSMDSN